MGSTDRPIVDTGTFTNTDNHHTSSTGNYCDGNYGVTITYPWTTNEALMKKMDEILNRMSVIEQSLLKLFAMLPEPDKKK